MKLYHKISNCNNVLESVFYDKFLNPKYLNEISHIFQIDMFHFLPLKQHPYYDFNKVSYSKFERGLSNK